MRLSATILCLLTVTLPVRAPAAEDQALKGPLAVLGLVSEEADRDAVAGFAKMIQNRLRQSGRVEVYTAEMIANLLTGGGPTVSAKESLDRLKGLFQQGYLQSYSFEYRRALQTLQKVLEGLDRLPPDPARWELWIKAQIFLGISQNGLKNEAQALKSFAAVLRTRPDMQLSRREYSPKTIKLFEKARKRLAGVERGSLAVQTDPPGAEVLLDGKPVGKTPFIGKFPYGQYHLQVRHQRIGGAVRWVRIGPEPARVRLQLSFEGALILDRTYPCVKLPGEKDRLPEQWWPWLGDRLGLRLLVAVRHYREAGRPYLSAALVDLERGLRIREASLEIQDASPGAQDQNAKALSDFLITGKAIPSLQVRKLSASAEPDPIGQRVPDLPARYAPRPWTRKWWPYAAASGVLLGFGLGSQLASDHYQRQADQVGSVAQREATQQTADTWVAQREATQQTADTWLGLAIAGYALAGATVATGLILYFSYEPEEVFGDSALAPALGPDTLGMVWILPF